MPTRVRGATQTSAVTGDSNHKLKLRFTNPYRLLIDTRDTPAMS